MNLNQLSEKSTSPQWTFAKYSIELDLPIKRMNLICGGKENLGPFGAVNMALVVTRNEIRANVGHQYASVF